MATQSILYPATPTAFTMTSNTSLGNFVAAQGAIVTNTSNLLIDSMISGFSTVGAAVALGDEYMLFASSDGTTLSKPATGTDATLTLLTAYPHIFASLDALQYGQIVPGTGLVFGFRINMTGLAIGTAVGFPTMFVAAAFGGNLPYGGWGPVQVNMQGQAHDATAGHFVVNWTGIKYTIA